VTAARRGITLVELLVAMALMLVLLGLLTSIFAVSARSYRVNETSAALQQRTELAATLLRYELGLAGYRGARTDYALNTFTSPTQRLIVVRGATTAQPHSVRARYYEDRHVATGAASVLRDVTYSIGTVGGVPALMRSEAGVAAPALLGVSDLRVVNLVRADGTSTAFGASFPTSNPAEALELSVTFVDGDTIRFVVAPQNVDFADAGQAAVQ
jgi:prepilin-type N-terminal cleavage/methylation domain-containing protein